MTFCLPRFEPGGYVQGSSTLPALISLSGTPAPALLDSTAPGPKWEPRPSRRGRDDEKRLAADFIELAPEKPSHYAICATKLFDAGGFCLLKVAGLRFTFFLFNAVAGIYSCHVRESFSTKQSFECVILFLKKFHVILSQTQFYSRKSLLNCLQSIKKVFMPSTHVVDDELEHDILV
jgi:hypothetical protein